MTRRPTTPTTGMSVLSRGQTTVLARGAMDHDTVGCLSTGEPKPQPGMRWKVLGIPSTGRKDERRWRFIAHARDEAEAQRIGRAAVRSPEWTKWCHVRVSSSSHWQAAAPKPRPPRDPAERNSLNQVVVLGLVRRVLTALGKTEPPEIATWPAPRLERMFRDLDGNAVLSKHARSKAKGGKGWRRKLNRKR